MKRLMIFGILMGAGQFVFGQRINDPTYSAGNYKHPNKAQYAKQHNLDNTTVMETTEVSASDNYKAPYSKRKIKKPAFIASKEQNSKQSYKHPFGL